MLDASVLIAYLDRDDPHHTRADELLRSAIDEEFTASTLTVAEVLVVPAREGRLPTARAAFQALEIRELPLAGGSAQALAELRAETKLKMPDCCVLLAAEQEQGRLASFDQRLVQVASGRGLETLT